MSFAQLAKQAVRDAVAHVGSPVRLSLCGQDAIDICGAYWRDDETVFDKRDGMIVASSSHWLMIERCALTGQRYPVVGDAVIVTLDDLQIMFKVASPPKTDGASIRLRLFVNDEHQMNEPTFESY